MDCGPAPHGDRSQPVPSVVGTATEWERPCGFQGDPIWVSRSRRRLSVELAQRWQWYAVSGQLNDMAARTLLLKLHERGLITLPERRRAPVTRRLDAGPDLFDALPPAPVVRNLSTGGSAGPPSNAPGGCRGSPTTADFYSCLGSTSRIWPRIFWRGLLNGSPRTGNNATTIPFICWRPSCSRIGSGAPVTRRPTGCAWAKPPGGPARVNATATTRYTLR